MMITKKKICETFKAMTEGDVTMSKKQLWLVLICVMMTGIVYGLLKAPMTHGVRIGCYNGNYNGNAAQPDEEEEPKSEEKKKKCCKKEDRSLESKLEKEISK